MEKFTLLERQLCDIQGRLFEMAIDDLKEIHRKRIMAEK